MIDASFNKSLLLLVGENRKSWLRRMSDDIPLWFSKHRFPSESLGSSLFLIQIAIFWDFDGILYPVPPSCPRPPQKKEADMATEPADVHGTFMGKSSIPSSNQTWRAGKRTTNQWFSHWNFHLHGISQLIGLREKLQENPMFHGKIYGFRLRFSLK